MTEHMDNRDLMMLMRGKSGGDSKFLQERFSKEPFEFYHYIVMSEQIEDEQLIPCLEQYQNLADFVDFHLMPYSEATKLQMNVLDSSNIKKI